MASAIAKTVPDSSAFNVRLSHTGTMMTETGANHFYAKHSSMNISECVVEVEDENRRSSVKLKKLTVLQDGVTRFPKLAECAHFHYEFADFGNLNLTLDEDVELDAQSEQWFVISVGCNAKKWTIRRTYESLYVLDKQLHRCIYDRKFSMLPELTKDLIEEEGSLRALGKISAYLNRFSVLADNMINCGPILCWMEMDNHGKRLIVPDNDAAVNIPAVGAAHAVKRYVAQSPDEISFEVGDILSIIDKPPSHESTWWRGKKGFEVGYFPSDFVEIIGKIPPSVVTLASASAKPVLHRRGKMTSFLVGFFSSRPNRSTLRQTGIMKERVFGCDLGEHLLNSGEDVPLVLKCCAEVLETHGIVDGIYRLCGVASNLQKLRNEFDENHVPDLTTEMYLQDIHCISSLVKMYFRELPNPLLTYPLYDRFTSAIDEVSYENKLNRLREVVRQLPPPHFRTAEFLFKHLSRMASSHSETSMHCKNLAIVWAPNLLRSKDLDQASCVAALKGASLQAVVTEFLITSVDEVFDETCRLSFGIQDSGSCSSLTRPKSVGLPSSGTKLLSLEEAQERALGSTAVKQQKCLSVGDGPAALTSMYHTVIDLPRGRKKNVRRSAISNWRSLFSRTHSMTLPSSLSTQGKFSDFASNASATLREGESLKRIKRTEATGDSDGTNDLLDGKRRSISCDVIDSASLDMSTLKSFVSKSNSPKPDAVSIDIDSTSFDTLRSFQSASVYEQLTLPVEKPFQTCLIHPSLTELEQPLRSPLPSFRKGSRVTSRPLSESSPTESEHYGQWQMPSGMSMSSLGSDKLFFDENHFKTPVPSKNTQLYSDHHDSRISSAAADYNRQSLSSFKPESCSETTAKNNSQLQNSNFKSYTKPLAQSSLCKNLEKSRSSSSSDRTGQLLSDEQEFLSWKLSESTRSRDLLSELSPVIGRVMPQNNYVSSVGDDSVFHPERTASPEMYESCQSLSVIIPATCDIGSIPENIDVSVNVDENDEARFSSLSFDDLHSNLHSKQFLRLEKNQKCREDFQERNFKTGRFKTRRNESPLGSTVSLSVDASRVDETGFGSGTPSILKHSAVSLSSEESHWKSSQIASRTGDQFSPVVNCGSESVDSRDSNQCSLADDSLNPLVVQQSNTMSGKEKKRGNSVSSVSRDFDGLDSSKHLGSLGDAGGSDCVNDLTFSTEMRKELLASSDRPLNTQDGSCESLSTVELFSSVESSVPAVREEVNLAMSLVSESTVCVSKYPSFCYHDGSISEVGQKLKRRDHTSDQTEEALTRCTSFFKPPVPSRRSAPEATKPRSMQDSPSPVHRPECLSFQEHHKLQEQPESPSDDVFLNSVDVSTKSLQSECASNQLTNSLPADFSIDKHKQSKTSNSPIVAEREFSSSVSFSSSSASSRSDLRSFGSHSPATERAPSTGDHATSIPTFSSNAKADERQRKPKIKRKTDLPEPTSASEFFSESENSSVAGLRGVDTQSSDSTVYAEILRTRSLRRSGPRPEVQGKSNAGVYVTRASAPFSSSNVRPGKLPSTINLGSSLKERKKVFEKAVLKSSFS